MARLRSLTQSQGSARSVHPTEVDCTWQVLQDATKGPVLTLSTFGSDDRQSQPKVSQTIQLDVAVARQLHDLLARTFDL